MAHSKGDWWPEKKKLEVVVNYLLFGNVARVSKMCDVPDGTVRRWMIEPWWKELCEQIQSDNDQELDSRLQKHLHKVLDLAEDRLENGDFMFNPKEGIFVRRPVTLKDGWKVGREMFDVRMVLRKQKPDQVSQEGIADILKGLAQEFAQMAKKRVKEKLDHGEIPQSENPTQTEVLSGSGLQIGVPKLPGETIPDKEAVHAEQSSEITRKSGLGT